MRFTTLSDWLNYQQNLNPQVIDLGLERVARVYRRLGEPVLANTVITVAGTNGKGSTVAAYEYWLHGRGYRVASYTSPHLLRYNERVRFDLNPVDDESLCRAFDRVEQARGADALTYFEFGTLAAFLLIAEQQPDFAILEVGLGGRLDAVNIIDADLAHITMIGLDHQDWLGDTRDLIALEKAGILREAAPTVCNDPDPPASLLEKLACNGRHWRLGEDYRYERTNEGDFYWIAGSRRVHIDLPAGEGFQARNFSGVLAGLELLGQLDGLFDREIADGFRNVELAGRFQTLETPMSARLVVDVGHNPDAARVIAEELRALDPGGRIVVLLGMLTDKDHNAFFSLLDPLVDEWWLLDLDCERGLKGDELLAKLVQKPRNYRLFNDAVEALDEAMSSLGNQDILLATGSFMTVEAVLRTPIIR